MRSWIERHQVLAVALAGGAAFVAWELRLVVVVLFVGYILAAAMRPAVDWLERHRAPRVVAILGLYIVFFGLLGWVLSAAVAPLIAQAHSFGQRLAELGHTLSAHVPFVGPDQLANLVDYLQSQAAAAASSGFTVGASALSALIISIYLLYDWHRLHRRGGRVSHAIRGAVEESDYALGAWARGQVLLSGIVGAMSFVALMGLGVEFAPVLAVLAFIFEFLPFAGPFISGALAVLFALNQSAATAIIVAIVYVVIQQVEANLLVPMVMRRAVDLHPVAVIAVMLCGFEILGIVGVLLAVPVAVVVRILWLRLLHA